jgi:hypothetical protein
MFEEGNAELEEIDPFCQRANVNNQFIALNFATNSVPTPQINIWAGNGQSFARDAEREKMEAVRLAVIE